MMMMMKRMCHAGGGVSGTRVFFIEKGIRRIWWGWGLGVARGQDKAAILTIHVLSLLSLSPPTAYRWHSFYIWPARPHNTISNLLSPPHPFFFIIIINFLPNYLDFYFYFYFLKIVLSFFLNKLKKKTETLSSEVPIIIRFRFRIQPLYAWQSDPSDLNFSCSLAGVLKTVRRDPLKSFVTIFETCQLHHTPL